MYSTLPHPHLIWMDLWQYSSGLPVVLAGPFGPLMACGLNPTDWPSLLDPYALLNTYAMLPNAMMNGLAKANGSD